VTVKRSTERQRPVMLSRFVNESALDHSGDAENIAVPRLESSRFVKLGNWKP
jgi:hypothetical protein